MIIGERIGALVSADGDVVKFLGYGTYAGYEVPPAMGSRSLTTLMNQMGVENPKLVLDNGDVVWGCECWWATEKETREEIAKYAHVEDVRIADCRGEPVRTP
jgi:hypothetical protein